MGVAGVGRLRRAGEASCRAGPQGRLRRDGDGERHSGLESPPDGRYGSGLADLGSEHVGGGGEGGV